MSKISNAESADRSWLVDALDAPGSIWGPGSPRWWEASKRLHAEWFRLREMANDSPGRRLRLVVDPWKGKAGMRKEGERLVVLSIEKSGRLHIRVFGFDGQLELDTDETKLPPEPDEERLAERDHCIIALKPLLLVLGARRRAMKARERTLKRRLNADERDEFVITADESAEVIRRMISILPPTPALEREQQALILEANADNAQKVWWEHSKTFWAAWQHMKQNNHPAWEILGEIVPDIKGMDEIDPTEAARLVRKARAMLGTEAGEPTSEEHRLISILRNTGKRAKGMPAMLVESMIGKPEAEVGWVSDYMWREGKYVDAERAGVLRKHAIAATDVARENGIRLRYRVRAARVYKDLLPE